MPKKSKKLDELFHDGLRDIYFAEKKILVALPKMAKAAESEELANAFKEHEMQTKEQVSRLEKVFQLIDETPRGKNCPAITGIIDEGEEIIDEYEDSPALDAGLIGAAQAVEHYEIARYGTLKAWAKELGLDEAVSLLDATLAEEENTDARLSNLAESAINQKAEAAA
jgi:ferritin-like metal-binding protein YciE